MRKNISGKIALFGILALLVVLTVLSASAVSDAIRGDAIRSDAIRGDAIRGDAIRGDAIRSDAIRSDAIYIRLRPDPASIPEGECHSVTVDVLMYSKPGYTVNSWGTWIQFDPTCVNITDYEYKSDMNSNTQWQHLGDRIKLWNYKAACSEYLDETVLVSLTVHCENPSYCESPLNFIDNDVPPDKFVACVLEERTTTWHDGTIIQGTTELPDLNVTEITPNCGYLFAKEGNEICAKIENIGGGDAGAFNVRFEIDGFSTEVGIAGLAAGENTTVCITDTTIRNAADFVTITVTADCDGEVPESDEQNNVLSLETTVVNNGYKGKRYTGGEDINTWDTFALNGNLIYSPGDSYYLSAYYNPDWTEYNVGWTTGDLPIPGTATIETARLFVPYTWDKAEVIPGSVDMSFNGNLQTLDAHYSDEKSWGASYPYGMLVYDVTTDFDTLGNVANLTNSHPGGDNVSMRGMLLVVVYADDSEPERTILMNEGFDLLYGGAGKCTTPEEATAYAPFGSIDTTEVQQATLITVAPGAGPNEGELGFNTQMWYDVWNFVGSTQIGIAETDVTSYLQAGDNEAYFRSSADYMEASNAFLILEMKGEIPCPADYALYQANVRDPEGRLNELRALRDQKLDDGYVDKYYDNSPALTLVLSKADSDLVKEGAQLVSKYSIPVGLHVQGMDVNERITKQDVEEALSFTGRLKIEVLENRDAIGAKSTEAIIDFIDEFEGQVKASEGKTFSAALKSSIYYESGQLRANPAVVKE